MLSNIPLMIKVSKKKTKTVSFESMSFPYQELIIFIFRTDHIYSFFHSLTDFSYKI